MNGGFEAREVDHRADLYSLGVAVFQMLAGRLPVMSSNSGQVLISHLHASPPDAPERVADALARILAKTPDERFASADDFFRALDEPPLPPQPDDIFLFSEVE